jgi:RecJ-like exonuclease
MACEYCGGRGYVPSIGNMDCPVCNRDGKNDKKA